MRILYHHRIGSKDGQYVHIEELVTALRRRGHEVLIVGPSATAQSSFGDDAGLVDRLKRSLPRWVYELAEAGYGLYATLRLGRAWRRQRPDLIYERYNLLTPAGAILRRLTGTRLLLEVNAPLAEERARFDGLGLPGLARWLERLVWRSADRVLVVTDVLAERVRAAGVAPDRVVTIPNGIDPVRVAAALAPQEARATLGIPADRLVLGFVGFVKAWHSVGTALDWLATPAGADALLLIAGDGPARAELEARARELGVAKRVRWLGILPRERVLDVVAAFDVALQPAVVDYASPLKLFEYMALGRAIIAPDSPNIREILTDERDALLCAPDAITATLDRLAADPSLRARLGTEAAATIERRGLTWDENARRVEALA